MLSSFQNFGKVYVANANFVWGSDLETVINTVSRHFTDFNNNGFYPHADEEQIRQELLGIPVLRDLKQAVAGFEDAKAIVIANLGLKDLPEADRNAVLYALTLTQGYPTSTDQRTKRVAWNVKAREMSAQDARFVTFSERIGNADMHTDSSFYPMPEEQFILYVVSAAGCQGGVSLIVDVDDIRAELQKTEAGRDAYALLRDTEIPFRVPSVYAAKDDQVEVFMAPVFTERPDEEGGLTIRWRFDSMLKGLAVRPELNTPAIEAALHLVNDVVEQRTPRFSEWLGDDTLLLADNHRTLHGRTTYEDPKRHLIRIRISDVPNAHRIGPSGIAAD